MINEHQVTLFQNKVNASAGLGVNAYSSINAGNSTSVTSSDNAGLSQETAPDNTTAPAPFDGGEPVTQEWLDTRNQLFDDLRSHYDTQKTIAYNTRDGEFWNTTYLRNSDGDSIIKTIEQFSSTRFREAYDTRPNSILDSLAEHYELSGANELIEKYPGIISLARQAERPELAGPGLNGLAVAPADVLAMLDIQLSDPDIQKFINHDTAPIPEPDNPAARAQLYLYGEQRYEQMVRYGRAMENVRNLYAHAIRTDQVDTFLAEDTATTRLAIAYFGPTSFSELPLSEGLSYTHASTASGWYVTNRNGGWPTTLKNPDVRALDLNNLPDLHDISAIQFAPGVGWVTPHDNVDRDTIVTDLVKFGFVGAFSYITGGLASGFAAGLFGAGTVGATIGGAALSGLASSAISGAVNGNFDWDDVLKGAMTGALTAGLNRIPQVQQLNQVDGAIGSIGRIGTSTVTQGIVAEATGGDFNDGAVSGLIAGISGEMLRDMDAAITDSGISGVQELAARQSARMVSSAVRIMHSDGHPGQLFAQEFISGLIAVAGDNLRVSEGGPTIGEALYDAGFEAGESFADILNPTLTVEDVIWSGRRCSDR